MKERKPKRHYREYTVQEATEITRLYAFMPVANIAKKLKRTVGAIHQFARRYELKKDPFVWNNRDKAGKNNHHNQAA